MGLYDNAPAGAADRGLRSYLEAARPQVASMLGLSPQSRINDAFSANSAVNPPMQDFNQSFGGMPFNNPADRQSLLQKYLQARSAQPPAASPAPQESSAPGPDNSDQGYYGGSPATNPNLQPTGSPFPWQGSPFSGFLDRMSEMGGQSGAGLIPKFVHLLGRSNS